ncbi:MAG: carboxypeptidase-like regulatory domain-containing protein, partial [Gemmatimonadales bacterium]
FLVVLLAVSAAPAWLQAQTAASGYVSGTVSDPTGAVVPGAEVKLEDPATGTAYTVTTNAAGRFVFPSVAPALYKITASMQGFRTATVSGLKVDIAKSYTQNFTLEVGAVEQVVEVTAGAAVELQTTDAAVGSTVGGEALLRMPSASRSVAGLLLLQPNTIPGRGETNLTGGQVAGARSDQNTYLIDGGEATSNVEGTGGYNTGQAGEPVPMIPVPVDSIEEFRVSTTNQNATFGRSQGGQIVLTTKRGTNTVHGSAYWYHQNDNLNANTWTRNRTGVDKPELKDNRYGFSLGGPIVKDSTWLFGHFESRRFPRSSEITRLVPTAAMRAGILVFTDAAGNDVQYDLNGTTGCLGGACDPRARGLSPVVADVYNILPVGNDTALGDGLNTIGFRATVDNTLETNFFVARLDQKITDRWNFFASYRYFNQLEPSLGQIDISNLLGNGVAPAASNPLEPRYIVGGFSGQITPNLTSETRISWYRHWWLWDRTDPFPPVASSGIALALAREGAAGLVAEPINFDAQRARDRLWNGKDTFVSENLSWIKGSHTIQFGGSFRNQHIIHTRSDKVTGGLTGGPTAFLERGGSLRLSTADRPPACSAIVTTNCLQSGDLAVWDDLYALTLGIVDNATRVIVNDSNFIPQPNIFGNTVDVTIQATEVYAQDIWRVTPGLTVTFGLTYQVQVPPEEATGRQSFPVFADTLSPVVMED